MKPKKPSGNTKMTAAPLAKKAKNHPAKLQPDQDIGAAEGGGHDAGYFKMKKKAKSGKKASVGSNDIRKALAVANNLIERMVSPKYRDEREQDQEYGTFVPKEIRLGSAKVYTKHPRWTFGNYRASSASARAAKLKLFYKCSAPLPLDDPTEFLDKVFNTPDVIQDRYMRGEGSWLRACRGKVIKAVEAGDESFILELAQLIAERPKYCSASPIWADKHGASDEWKPKTQTDRKRCILAWNWVAQPLWLMSSVDACDFIKKTIGLIVTPADYNFIKHELRLRQHPKRPVRGITDKGELVLRERWKFPDEKSLLNEMSAFANVNDEMTLTP